MQKNVTTDVILGECIKSILYLLCNFVAPKSYEYTKDIEDIVVNIETSKQCEILYKLNGENYYSGMQEQGFSIIKFIPQQREKNSHRHKRCNVTADVDDSVINEGGNVSLIHSNVFGNSSEWDQVYSCFQLLKIVAVKSKPNSLAEQKPQHYERVIYKAGKNNSFLFHKTT